MTRVLMVLCFAIAYVLLTLLVSKDTFHFFRVWSPLILSFPFSHVCLRDCKSPSEPSDQLLGFCSSGPRYCATKISGDQMEGLISTYSDLVTTYSFFLFLSCVSTGLEISFRNWLSIRVALDPVPRKYREINWKDSFDLIRVRSPLIVSFSCSHACLRDWKSPSEPSDQ